MIVFLIAAISVDGYIAERTDQVSTSWNSKEDRKWFSQRTKQARVVVMGSTTFNTFKRALPERLLMIYTRNPESQTASDPTQIQYTNLEPAALIQKLKDENYSEVAVCGGSSIYTMFLKAGLINKLYLTVEPKLFGKGVPLFNENFEANLRLVKTEMLSDQTLLLEYDVVTATDTNPTDVNTKASA